MNLLTVPKKRVNPRLTRYALKRLEEIDLYLPALPKTPDDEDYQNLPSNVTEISLAELGERHTAMTAWSSYANAKLALAEIEISEICEVMGEIEAHVYIDFEQTSAREKWKFEKQVARDRKWTELNLRLLERSAFRDLLRSLAVGYENKAKCLSREMTRRMGEMESVSR